ncbi:MAG TPA: hypothetical protein DIT67_14630 [Octadecabacter sp.]|nr:hypothetical protein [Octadecabacter sp.]
MIADNLGLIVVIGFGAYLIYTAFSGSRFNQRQYETQDRQKDYAAFTKALQEKQIELTERQVNALERIADELEAKNKR